MAQAGTTIKKRLMVKAFARTGILLPALEIAGVGRRTHYRWLKTDTKYAEAFSRAQEEAIERLEMEADRRARDGVYRMKFHQGQPIMVPCDPSDPGAIHASDDKSGKPIYLKPYIEHEYSDTLLIFRLKALKPEKYRDHQDRQGDLGAAPLIIPVVVTDREQAQQAIAFDEHRRRMFENVDN